MANKKLNWDFNPCLSDSFSLHHSAFDFQEIVKYCSAALQNKALFILRLTEHF